MGRVDRVDFDGHMWCVTVPTGAFVARTAAGPFVTGNSGMNKAGCIGKQIDKMHGAEREVLGPRVRVDGKKPGHVGIGSGSTYGADAGLDGLVQTAPATDDAKRWTGWHSQIAPGHEQWLIARKPSKLTYARQLLEHGCGAFNVDGCRIPRGDIEDMKGRSGRATGDQDAYGAGLGKREAGTFEPNPAGSHPRNVVLTPGGEGCPVEGLDRQSGITTSNGARVGGGGGIFCVVGDGTPTGLGDTGGASRYFTRFDQVVKYCGKASDRSVPGRSDLRNEHPTIKNPELMRWLVRLMAATAEHTGDSPAVVLDPFMGSGTTGWACIAEGVHFVGIEKDPAHFEVARARIIGAQGSPEEAAKANEAAPKGGQLGMF